MSISERVNGGEIESGELESLNTEELLKWAFKTIHPRLALACSFQAEESVLIDIMYRLQGTDFRIFALDTGRLNQETYECMDAIRERYGIQVEVFFPDAARVEGMVRDHGLNLFYQSVDFRKLCCGIRKVEPLNRALKDLDGWMTGLRREQSVTRTAVRKVEIDNDHGGIFKLNPLVDWDHEQVWNYIRENNVPYNKLHDRGFPSIGCAPCTRAIKPGEDSRAGRWWWENPESKECGLHVNSAAKSEEMVVEKNLTGFIKPHGKQLVDRILVGEEGEAVRDRAKELKKIALNARTLSDLELLAVGAFSPLEGFMGKEDYQRVIHEMRLASGPIWTLPITLAVSADEAKELREGEDIALLDSTGEVAGLLSLEEKFDYDKKEEAWNVYKTDEDRHPGVWYIYKRGDVLLGGKVSLLKRVPLASGFDAYRLDPAETRKVLKQRGWRTVVGFQTRNPIHRSHEYIQKCALELMDGLLIHPLVGKTKLDDIPSEVRLRCYEVLVEHYFPKDRALLAVFPGAMRYAGPREAVFHALVRKNYGCTHFIVGRDAAGVGGYYGPYDAWDLFGHFRRDELDITPLFFSETFFCRCCDAVASTKTCPHDRDHRVTLSGTGVRELLGRGDPLPSEFTRPEVGAVLDEWSRNSIQPSGVED
jgi:sulfate adenylyltransferase